MTNKFLDYGFGFNDENLKNGSIDIYAKSLKASNMNPNSVVVTDSNGVMVSTSDFETTNIDITGVYKIAGNTVLSANALGTGVTSSSLQTLGSLSSLTVSQTGAVIANLISTSSNADLNLDRAGTSNECLVQYKTAGTTNWTTGIDNTPTGGNTDYVIKKTNNGDPPEFIVKSGGNVGIGILAPSYKLDVTGSIHSSVGVVAPYYNTGISVLGGHSIIVGAQYNGAVGAGNYVFGGGLIPDSDPDVFFSGYNLPTAGKVVGFTIQCGDISTITGYCQIINESGGLVHIIQGNIVGDYMSNNFPITSDNTFSEDYKLIFKVQSGTANSTLSFSAFVIFD